MSQNLSSDAVVIGALRVNVNKTFFNSECLVIFNALMSYADFFQN